MLKQKKLVLAALAVILVGLAASLALYTFVLKPQTENYAYKLDYQGMLFLSNEAEPSDYLRAFSSFNEFIVAPYFDEDNVPLMTKPLVLFQGILSAKQKRVISLALVFKGNELKSCQTNDGNALVNKEISVGECNALLSSYVPKIMISKPDKSLKQSKIILGNNSIIINPKDDYDLMNSSYSVLRTMFVDIEETIQKINKVIAALPG
jgi:hypothetical protein